MAGRGPAPKPADRKAGHSKDSHPTTVLRFERADAPDLPAGLAESAEVARWWNVWANSPQAEHFGATDWEFMLETAYLVRKFYEGNMNVAAELRMRQAKYGATPEDRLRLRMQFAQADEMDAKRPAPASSSRERRGSLHSLPSASSE